MGPRVDIMTALGVCFLIAPGVGLAAVFADRYFGGVPVSARRLILAAAVSGVIGAVPGSFVIAVAPEGNLPALPFGLIAGVLYGSVVGLLVAGVRAAGARQANPSAAAADSFSRSQLEAAVQATLQPMLAQPFDTLLGLPTAAGAPYSDGPRPAAIWTYVAHEAPDRVRIVVQVCSPSAPGSSFSQVYAQGVRRWTDGRTSPVLEPEIHEFM